MSLEELEGMVNAFKARGWKCDDAEKQLAERKKTSTAASVSFESARAQTRKLEKNAKQQAEKHARMQKQCHEALSKLEATAKELATARRLELELLAREHAHKAGDTDVKSEKKAIRIDLTTLLDEESPPIDIQFGDLLDGIDGELSAEEQEEKDNLIKSFGVEAVAAARKQLEPMLNYFKQQAQLQKAFRDRAAKRRRGQDGTPSTTTSTTEAEPKNGRAASSEDAAASAASVSKDDDADTAEARRIVQRLRAESEGPNVQLDSKATA